MPTIWVPIEPSRCCVRARRVDRTMIEEAATRVARDPRREGDRRDRRDERPQEVVDVAAQEDARVGEAALAEPSASAERDEQFLRIRLEQLLELLGILDHVRIEDGNEPCVSGGDHDEPGEQGAAAAEVERERRADHRPISDVSSASTSSAFIGSSRS